MIIPNEWTELLNLYNLRPIKTTEAHVQAMQILETLSGFPELNEDQSDYLTALALVIENYEKQQWPLENKNDPVEILKFVLDQNNMTAKDLGLILGDDLLGDKILSGQQDLTVKHIKKLSKRFCVNPSLFI